MTPTRRNRLGRRVQRIVDWLGGWPTVLAIAVVLGVAALLMGGRLLLGAARSAEAAAVNAEHASEDSAELLRLATELTNPQGAAAQRAMEQRQDIIDRLDRIHQGLLAAGGDLAANHADVLAELSALRVEVQRLGSG